MSTSTKTIHFSFQFYTIVIQNRNFDFGSIKIHQLLDLSLVKVECLQPSVWVHNVSPAEDW